MRLRQAQSKFVLMVARLIQWAYDNGYELTFGEAWRTDEQAEIHALGFEGRDDLIDLIRKQFPDLANKIANNTGNGSRTSLHMDRLAIDFNLFKNGKLLMSYDAYLPLGQYWESIGGAWGGRFGDAPHFSLAFGGRK